MLYIKKTFEYLFKLENGKRFLTLFLIALPCGVGAYFTAPTYVYHNWLKEFTVGDKSYLSALFFNGNANPMRVLIAGIITTFVLMFCISVMASVVSRNLRVGVFSINRRLMMEFNEAILPTFFAVLSAMVLVVVGKLLLATLIVLFQTIKNVVLSAILSTFALFLNIALVCYAISVAILYLPYMTFNGLKPMVALAQSANRVGGRIGGRIFVAVFVPVLLVYVTGALVGMAENFIASTVVESVLYASTLVYLLTLSFISYYEINELPREDYPREFFFTKIKRR
ncbi:MAG: hypothetical protein IKB56_00635 [Clostridia bacterium]|nr:hypothetical protein [Clostridia bacterium]